MRVTSRRIPSICADLFAGQSEFHHVTLNEPMLSDLVELWPGGPAITFADYFITFRYVFSAAFLTWAVALVRWPSRWWLFCGSVLLGCFAWIVLLEVPLGRPYGLVEGERGLAALASSMVTAARGTTADGWMVKQPNAYPLWSMVLAVASGFDADRLLFIYEHLAVVGMVFLAGTIFWSTKALSGDSQGLVRGLSVFFALFLSSTRLSFLRSPGPLWPEVFGQQPHLAFALGLLMIWLRLLGEARRLSSFLAAGVVLGLLGGLEARLAGFAVVSVIVWLLVSRKRHRAKRAAGVSLAVAIAFFPLWVSRFEPSLVPASAGTWYFTFNQLLALTLDKGLLFYLALISLIRMLRSGKRAELLFSSLVMTGLIAWTGAGLSPPASSVIGIQVAGSLLNLSLAIAGALGAHDVLIWLAQRLDRVELPGKYLGSSPLHVVGIAALVALSLPWCFPYWWQPMLMDPVYVESIRPIAPQFGPLISWVKAETDSDAVFVTGPSYSPWIPALSGRRVLLVEGALIPPTDLAERLQAQFWFVESKSKTKISTAATRWGLTHFAWGRLDGNETMDVDFKFLERDRHFSPVWQQRRWVRVFEYSP